MSQDGIRWWNEARTGPSGRYILNDEGDPEPCEDLMTWAAFMENQDARRIALDTVGDVMVSTVFLGLDHNFAWLGRGANPHPLVFKTMVFNGPLDQEQDRYHTRLEALIGHAEMLAKVLNAAGVPS
jgi:hypothetical protein